MPLLDSDLFRQIVESLPVGVYVVALDRRILFWNQAAERITGYLGQEVLGRSCRDDVLVHCGAQSTPICSSSGCLLTCALRDRKPMEAALFARHKDGHRIPVHVHSIPLCNVDGNVHAIAEMFQQQAPGREVRWSGDSGPASHDGLNIPSIAATQEYLQSRLEQPVDSAVFLIEIEDIRDLARQRGREMVHAMMRTIVHTVADLFAMPHYLGRWRHERFLAIVPNATEQSFQELLAQLRGLSNSSTVMWWGDRITSSVRVFGTLVREHDSLADVLSRIEPPVPPQEIR